MHHTRTRNAIQSEKYFTQLVSWKVGRLEGNIFFFLLTGNITGGGWQLGQDRDVNYSWTLQTL